MIRFASLQFRSQAAVALFALLAVAILLAATGPHLVTVYASTVARCNGAGECAAAIRTLFGSDTLLQAWLNIMVLVAPGLVGVFWGAPLVAGEVESGTLRLAWAQSVTRWRWLAAKMAVVGVASVTVVGLLSLAVTWWFVPLDRAGADIYSTFDQRDIVPIAYSAFAFALGVAVGMLSRRILPAMAITGVVFVAVRIAFASLVAPTLLAPTVRAIHLDPATTGYGSSGFLPVGGTSMLQPTTPSISNAWITSVQIVDGAGHALTSRVLTKTCPHLGHTAGGVVIGGLGSGGSHRRAPPAVARVRYECVVKLSATYHEAVIYQPESHYWPLQWYEFGLFLGAAALLSGACLWQVRTVRRPRSRAAASPLSVA